MSILSIFIIIIPVLCFPFIITRTTLGIKRIIFHKKYSIEYLFWDLQVVIVFFISIFFTIIYPILVNSVLFEWNTYTGNTYNDLLYPVICPLTFLFYSILILIFQAARLFFYKTNPVDYESQKDNIGKMTLESSILKWRQLSIYLLFLSIILMLWMFIVVTIMSIGGLSQP